jgi:hypothetical protein
MSVANPYSYPAWMLTPRYQASIRACERILKAWGARDAARHAWSWVYDGMSAGDLLRVRRKYGPSSPKSTKIGTIVYGGRTRRWLSTRRDPVLLPRSRTRVDEGMSSRERRIVLLVGQGKRLSAEDAQVARDFGVRILREPSPGHFELTPYGRDVYRHVAGAKVVRIFDPRRGRRPARRDAERSSLGMFAGHSYHSALTAARAEAKKCRTPWYIKQFGASWYMTDTHPALPYVKVHVDERAVKHAMGDPRRKRSRRRDPMHKPTIYEALASKLGRRPTNDELRREVQRIKTEAYIEVASRGKLSHQRRRRR